MKHHVVETVGEKGQIDWIGGSLGTLWRFRLSPPRLPRVLFVKKGYTSFVGQLATRLCCFLVLVDGVCWGMRCGRLDPYAPWQQYPFAAYSTPGGMLLERFIAVRGQATTPPSSQPTGKRRAIYFLPCVRQSVSAEHTFAYPVRHHSLCPCLSLSHPRPRPPPEKMRRKEREQVVDAPSSSSSSSSGDMNDGENSAVKMGAEAFVAKRNGSDGYGQPEWETDETLEAYLSS